jgi:hypothetical protein
MQVTEARIVGRFGDDGAMPAHPDPWGVTSYGSDSKEMASWSLARLGERTLK